MKCAIHTDRDAVAACSTCGRFVCPECKVSIGGRDYCNTCLQSRLKTGGNNVWISLIALLGLIPWIGWIIELVMHIVLGIHGNEWAWQRKKWESIEHFKKTQRTWMWWGVSLLIAYVIFAIALVVLMFSLYKIGANLGIDKNLWGNMMPWL